MGRIKNIYISPSVIKSLFVASTLFANIINSFFVILLLLLRSLLTTYCNFSLATEVRHRPCTATLSKIWAYRELKSASFLTVKKITKGKKDKNADSTLPLTSKDLAVSILDTKMNPDATSGCASTGRGQSPDIADDIEVATILMMMGIDPSSIQSSYEGVGQSEALGGLKTMVIDKKDCQRKVTGTPSRFQRRFVRLGGKLAARRLEYDIRHHPLDDVVRFRMRGRRRKA